MKRLCPEPVVAAEVADHEDTTIVEVQAVRVVAAREVRTWRPIVAAVANDAQLTRAVVTQGGQVEVIACGGGGRETGVDTGIVIILPCCT